MRALSRIDDESVAAPLAAVLLDDDPEFQKAVRFAVFGTIRRKARLPVQPFLEAFDKGNPLARREALPIIGGIQRDREAHKGAVETIFRGLNDPDPDVREAALRVLAAAGTGIHDGGTWIHDDRAVEPLLHALGHKDDTVRTDAASSLAQYKDRRAVPLLIAQLKDQGGNNARACAAFALGEIGDAAAVEALCARLKDEPVDYVRDEAAVALGKIGSPKALEALFQTVRDPERTGMRHRHIAAIEKITGEFYQKHPLWQKLLDDEKRGGGGR
jgi:HEAT repeat protein